jgi:hypothetical protein
MVKVLPSAEASGRLKLIYCLSTVYHLVSGAELSGRSKYVIDQKFSHDPKVQTGKGQSSPFLGELVLPDV